MNTRFNHSFVDEVSFLIKYIPRIFESSDLSSVQGGPRVNADKLVDNETLDSRELDYEHFNHHVLRAAVSRVVGLVKILELENKNCSETEIFRKLLKSCDELEGVMNEASSILTTDLE